MFFEAAIPSILIFLQISYLYSCAINIFINYEIRFNPAFIGVDRVFLLTGCKEKNRLFSKNILPSTPFIGNRTKAVQPLERISFDDDKNNSQC